MRRFLVASLAVSLAAVAVSACARGDAAADSVAAVPASEVTTTGELSADSAARAGQGDLALSISKSREREGSFRDAGAIRTCGPSSAGGTDFVVSFTASGPGAKDHPLQNLTFQADALPAGGSTKSFNLDATLQNLGMQKGQVTPLPALSIQTGTTGTGTARLTDTNGQLRLEVDGKTDRGESVELTVKCAKR